MIAELGQISLSLAFVFALLQVLTPPLGRWLGNGALALLAEGASRTVFLLTGLAFALLIVANVRSDFSVVTVWQNSHQDLPLLYKVTGTWGNHEGSMLLWIVILTFCSAAVTLKARDLPLHFYTSVLAVQGVLSSLFLAFLLFTSNPFGRLLPAPVEGQDLNPLLQDIGLAIHPPLLYLGYVGFSIAFCFAIAALIEGRIDGVWARWVRPWSLFAWIALTLGIALGSYWAYYELGWGGWWFWDPVENASLMPWLLGTALIHMIAVVEKRESLKAWTLFLAISTFLLCLLGTFLVRSGVLTSVHNFASDPVRGYYILALLSFISLASFALFIARGSLMREGRAFQQISREGGLVLNNFGLVIACFIILIGTLYPVLLQAVTGGEGASLSVGAPFYELALYPLVFLFLILVPLGPLLAWKKGRIARVLRALILPFVLVILTDLLFIALAERLTVFSIIGFALGLWLVIGGFAEAGKRIWPGRLDGSLWNRIKGLNRQIWATAFGHAGFGIVFLGLSLASSNQSEQIVLLAPDRVITLNDYNLHFLGLESVEGPNYKETRGLFTLSQGDGTPIPFSAAKRFYPARGTTTTEAGILTLGLSQVYISLGDPRGDQTISARLYYKPYVLLIWIGALVMAFGGAFSLRFLFPSARFVPQHQEAERTSSRSLKGEMAQ